jgi:type VI secretion system secreted protein Hcp
LTWNSSKFNLLPSFNHPEGARSMSAIYVKIEGIEGESKDSKHKGWIDVMTCSYGVSQSSSMQTGGGGGVGKANFGAVTFSHRFDKSSPNLFQYCASGKHIPKVLVSVCKSGGGQEEYILLTLENVLITGVVPSGAEGSEWSESVSMSYSKIKIEAKEQAKGGAMQAAVTAGWDIKQNIPV